MRYWWVNQKQTHKHEIPGSFMWSPKRNRNGARNQFYENMRRTQVGDLVFSYFGQRINYIGVVAGEAETALMPPEFGKADWDRDGWYVPVQWSKIEPISPGAIKDDLLPLLPERYSPLNRRTGQGLENYLSEVPEPMAKRLLAEVDTLPAFDTDGEPPSVGYASAEAAEDTLESAITNDTSLAETERLALTRARRGQGLYRKNLAAVEAACRVTGVEDPRLLIASHAKPWCVCTTHSERLDGNNGLMLTPHVDYLFDRGLLSFADDGALLVSPRVPDLTLDKLGLGPSQRLPAAPFQALQLPYIRYHRDLRFKAE